MTIFDWYMVGITLWYVKKTFFAVLMLPVMDTKKYCICKGVTFLPKFCTIPKIQPCDCTIQIVGELLIEIIKLNKGMAQEQSKHFQALEQVSKIFKDTTNASITRMTTPTASTTSYSPTHKGNVKMTQKIHQHHTCMNTPIMPTEPPTTPITQPIQSQQSLHLQHNIITQDDEDNPMAINFIQHQVLYNHIPHLHMTAPLQLINNISLVKHYTNPLIHPERGEAITSYEKLANDPLTKDTWTKQWPWN